MNRNFINSLPVKIFPVAKELKNLGFYIIVHKPTRYEKAGEDIVQLTLFNEDKPYMHFAESINEVFNNIEYKNGVLKSEICDEAIYDLADVSVEGNFDKKKNERKEKINELINKYNIDLDLMKNDEDRNLITGLFCEYVENDLNFDILEGVIKNLIAKH